MKTLIKFVSVAVLKLEQLHAKLAVAFAFLSKKVELLLLIPVESPESLHVLRHDAIFLGLKFFCFD